MTLSMKFVYSRNFGLLHIIYLNSILFLDILILLCTVNHLLMQEFSVLLWTMQTLAIFQILLLREGESY